MRGCGGGGGGGLDEGHNMLYWQGDLSRNVGKKLPTMPCNYPKDHRLHQHHGRSLKSSTSALKELNSCILRVEVTFQKTAVFKYGVNFATPVLRYCARHGTIKTWNDNKRS
jgi:hypothetical protein